jgi:hypothetical protein
VRLFFPELCRRRSKAVDRSIDWDDRSRDRDVEVDRRELS